MPSAFVGFSGGWGHIDAVCAVAGRTERRKSDIDVARRVGMARLNRVGSGGIGPRRREKKGARLGGVAGATRR
ncbi:hypothetical protein RGUI_2352 [Rhodovulum sp. P5]|nr:hypothetical protein RGUI_2352 [Rhodovulum sp. P5]